jgi:hypothetical protein
MTAKPVAMATIRDVAREAGVSPTVAVATFTGSQSVSPDKRARVLAVAERLDYRPLQATTSFDAALLRGLADEYEHKGRRHMAVALRRGAEAIEAIKAIGAGR